ncbi:MAG: beta-propeller domain-containing protein [Deltaproteobacteria bacterium]|nr:beta-propeller domain-containing protein [Deltaproteobacteria bacterium]
MSIYPDLVAAAMASAVCGEPLGLDADEVREAFEDLYEANVKKIEEAGYLAWVPSVQDTWWFDGAAKLHGNPLADCEAYLLDSASDGGSLLSLLSFDMLQGSALEATTIRSRPGAVFASDQALYLAMRHRKYGAGSWYEGLPDESEATTFHKFRLSESAPTTSYVASGVVKGRILNQFSMGEHDGRLQVATTTGHLPGPAYNTVAVLEAKGDALEVVGMLDHLAPDEDIRAVRFGGDLAFVVTFKKTDPLFVIDMSDPHAPAVKGEMKIPGFSTYLHFMDPTHLLSIGFDADDQGSFAWIQGVMLQVFDVTDITNPTLMHKEVIGTRGSASEAAMDHLAFNWFPPKEWLAIPMVVCEGASGGGGMGDEMTFNGLMVYKVTLDAGFEYLGGIPHATTQEFGQWGGCGQWWSGSSSTVKRSIFMDDYAVSVALDRIEFALVADLGHPVATVELMD